MDPILTLILHPSNYYYYYIIIVLKRKPLYLIKKTFFPLDIFYYFANFQKIPQKFK